MTAWWKSLIAPGPAGPRRARAIGVAPAAGPAGASARRTRSPLTVTGSDWPPGTNRPNRDRAARARLTRLSRLTRFKFDGAGSAAPVIGLSVAGPAAGGAGLGR